MFRKIVTTEIYRAVFRSLGKQSDGPRFSQDGIKEFNSLVGVPTPAVLSQLAPGAGRADCRCRQLTRLPNSGTKPRRKPGSMSSAAP